MNQTERTMNAAVLTLSIIGTIGTLIAYATAELNFWTLIGGDLTQNGKFQFVNVIIHIVKCNIFVEVLV